jgi:hypothetical protein
MSYRPLKYPQYPATEEKAIKYTALLNRIHKDKKFIAVKRKQPIVIPINFAAVEEDQLDRFDEWIRI